MRELFHGKWDGICKFLKDRSKWLGLSFVVLVVVLYASACGTGEDEIVLEEASETVTAPVSEELAAAETSVESDIVVFVCGAVAHEGVYTLPEGGRVYEAVQEAGGFSPDADKEYVNQAMRLSDGDRLWIPTVEETECLAGSEEADGNVTGESSSGEGSEDYGISSGTENHQKISDAADDVGTEMVNINTADKTELMTLPGIGETRAEAILSYRETNGAFAAKEDLMNVDGIKEGIYGNLEDRICVE